MKDKIVIPLVDLKSQLRSLSPTLEGVIEQSVRSGNFIGGADVAAFEKSYATFCGAGHCVGVGNGTDALELALRACGIGGGAEVVTSAFSFFATAEAILNVGAKPVFVDVAPETGLLDCNRVEEALSPKTRAIVPVHLYGQPCDVARLRGVCNERDLMLVGDAAQAHGAKFGGRSIPAYEDATCFSFYPGKNLGALGDAGAVVANDESVAAKVRRLANHGRREKYLHEETGRNSRLDALQASVLSLKLERLSEWNERRRGIARRYLELLEGLPLGLPVLSVGAEHVWHLFTVRSRRRDELRSALLAAGVESGIHYPVPMHLQPGLAFLGHKAGDFPGAESVAESTLSLPMFPELRPEDQDRVVSVIGEVLAGA